jgi:hypothetical protein
LDLAPAEITEEMAAWAHDVCLDANDERHADEGAILPTDDDGLRVIDCAFALGDPPVRPTRTRAPGRRAATPGGTPARTTGGTTPAATATS